MALQGFRAGESVFGVFDGHGPNGMPCIAFHAFLVPCSPTEAAWQYGRHHLQHMHGMQYIMPRA